jgi:hypothetical protein
VLLYQLTNVAFAATAVMVQAELSTTLESLASMEAKEAVVRQRHRAKAATMH